MKMDEETRTVMWLKEGSPRTWETECSTGFCPECGCAVFADSNYCTKCGRCVRVNKHALRSKLTLRNAEMLVLLPLGLCFLFWKHAWPRAYNLVVRQHGR